MTNDFIDQLEEACTKEGKQFIILVADKDKDSGFVSGGLVRSNIADWKPMNPKVSVKEDIIDLLDQTVFDLEGYVDSCKDNQNYKD